MILCNSFIYYPIHVFTGLFTQGLITLGSLDSIEVHGLFMLGGSILTQEVNNIKLMETKKNLYIFTYFTSSFSYCRIRIAALFFTIFEFSLQLLLSPATSRMDKPVSV